MDKVVEKRDIKVAEFREYSSTALAEGIS